jgi:tetratricopeptide (TPR) repeat protein
MPPESFINKKMRKQILLLFMVVFSCLSSEVASQIQGEVKDNEELKALHDQDQSDRMGSKIDWSQVSQRDKERRTRVYELLDAHLVHTSKDHAHAAMIFQHGGDTISSGMAVKMMRKAVALDSSINKWLLAAAIDRDLLGRGYPQIYGTQFEKMGNQPWEFSRIDTTKVTDAERKEYGVGSLAEQREKVKLLNKKRLSELLTAGKSVDEIVKFCKQEDKDKSAYNLSEGGINSFGYDLMRQKRNEEALKIFKLNTKLYPKGFNAYDSFGECLLKLGKEKEAIKAYKKSLELNPKNKNAEKALAEITGK